jgi:hypothetical protein
MLTFMPTTTVGNIHEPTVGPKGLADYIPAIAHLLKLAMISVWENWVYLLNFSSFTYLPIGHSMVVTPVMYTAIFQPVFLQDWNTTTIQPI